MLPSKNFWLERSIKVATQENYLDRLFKVYPLEHSGLREIQPIVAQKIKDAYQAKNHAELLLNLLNQKRFPIKDSYVAFLRAYPEAINLNPSTVMRLGGMLQEMGIDSILKELQRPAETNTQIGPLFGRWLNEDIIGLPLLESKAFEESEVDAVLQGSDKIKQAFAKRNLNYNLDKGLDFVARIGGRYVIAEAKFVSAEGGNQRNQLATTREMLENNRIAAVRIALLDGVIYLPKHQNLLSKIVDYAGANNVMSALVLREFLFSL